ncbi:MAG: hypothetical protein COV30_02510 [Candidatus Yanofskybacteria bacterium CG10_big_fil_rev_8_21_14_0_10_37_15]|uniref:Uncharacterized protein n=1 Tax=Candidatus Yanofskybacteria bacterium CG10_big_fil_rev_8_21_14_0_10_37_15 TaxID=1975097 RepID=A0A2H0R766_9BACT|nr:MAG: hypothetical protein COV30_02510 [Candidatus Yanofskybacteria bacterium CG10_big_fil_rev_8_21_14_0_10_37_15]
MNFEIPEKHKIQPEIKQGEEKEETILPHGPKLRYLDNVFSILRAPERTEFDEEESWRNLSENVRPYENGLEFTDNIRNVVVEFVTKKIPRLKDNASSLGELGEEELLNALTHNYFEEFGEEVRGSRKEILLATMAHVVKRIENRVTRQMLSKATEEDLKKLGLNFSTRDLLNEVLEVSIKADLIYIRFMAYSQLSGKPPKEVGPVAFHLPGDDKLHTVPELFPHESQFLSKHFSKLSERGGEWVKFPGGETFQKYLEVLGNFYTEKNPERAMESQKEIERLYSELLDSDFPIIITPATEGYYKEPYYDPELKISLRTPDAKKEESNWRNMRDKLAESLDVLDARQFEDSVKEKDPKSVIVLGGFGVNITFNAVAQEKPNILIFLNEQIRAYDKKFPEVAKKWVANTTEIFGEELTDDKRNFLESISRDDTVLHELTHSVFPDDSSEAKRLGGRPYTIIDEVKAEICHRPLVPEVIKRGGLRGTKEEWAVGMLTASLQMALDQPPGDPYYYATVYTMNNLFQSGAVIIEGEKTRILAFEKYYEVQKKAAEELLNLYRNPEMTERKAAKWIKTHCVPNKEVQEVLKIVVKKD